MENKWFEEKNRTYRNAIENIPELFLPIVTNQTTAHHNIFVTKRWERVEFRFIKQIAPKNVDRFEILQNNSPNTYNYNTSDSRAP